MENIQFYRDHTHTECFFSAGEDNSIIFLKFTVIAGESFRYWIHPKIDWLRLFCKTASVSIVDPEMNVLASLTLNKAEVIQRISEVSQRKDLFQVEDK